MAYPNMFQQMAPYQNPYPNIYQNTYQPAPQMQVTKVNGRNGAEAFQIGANSSAILLDESGTMVWLVTTDGAGYKTISPYDIAPHKTVPAPDYADLETRIKRLEDAINGNTGDSATAKRRTAQSNAGETSAS